MLTGLCSLSACTKTLRGRNVLTLESKAGTQRGGSLGNAGTGQDSHHAGLPALLLSPLWLGRGGPFSLLLCSPGGMSPPREARRQLERCERGRQGQGAPAWIWGPTRLLGNSHPTPAHSGVQCPLPWGAYSSPQGRGQGGFLEETSVPRAG